MEPRNYLILAPGLEVQAGPDNGEERSILQREASLLQAARGEGWREKDGVVSSPDGLKMEMGSSQ